MNNKKGMPSFETNTPMPKVEAPKEIKMIYEDSHYTIPFCKVDFLCRVDSHVYVNGIDIRIGDKFDNFEKQYRAYVKSQTAPSLYITNTSNPKTTEFHG